MALLELQRELKLLGSAALAEEPALDSASWLGPLPWREVCDITVGLSVHGWSRTRVRHHCLPAWGLHCMAGGWGEVCDTWMAEALPGYNGVTSLWRAAVWRLAVGMLSEGGGVRHHCGAQPELCWREVCDITTVYCDAPESTTPWSSPWLRLAAWLLSVSSEAHWLSICVRGDSEIALSTLGGVYCELGVGA